MASKQDTTSQKPAMCYLLCTGDTSDAIYTAQDADIYIIGSNRNREGVVLSYTPLSSTILTPAIVDTELKADAPKPKSKSVIESTLAPEPIKQEKKNTENKILDRSVIASSAASIPAIVEKSQSTKEPSKPAMQYFLPTGDTSDAIYTPEEAENYICGKDRNRFGVDITILSQPLVNNTASVDAKAKLERDDLTAVSKKIVTGKDKNEKTEEQRFVANDEASKTEPAIKPASIITKETDKPSLVAEKDSNIDSTAMIENKETEKTVESQVVITKAPEKFSSVLATAKSGNDSIKSACSAAGFVDEAIAGATTTITTATVATINKIADSDKKEKQVIEKSTAPENDNINATNASFSERNVSEKDLEDNYVKAPAKEVKSVSTKREDMKQVKTQEAIKTDTVKTATESESESSSDDTSDDDSDNSDSDDSDSDNSSSEESDSDSDEESDSDDSDDSDDSEDDEEASESEKEQPEVFLYTSLSSAMNNMVSRTNRMAHILESHKIKFTYVDVATDERAKRLWRWKSKGRMLPGIVRDGEIICDFPELEEINEDHEVWAKVVEEEVY